MDSLKLLKEEYGISDDELDFAIGRAKGIVLGFAMEFRARKILEDMNFVNVKSVDLPTHDIEAEKDGEKFFIEVKASKKSPTKEYSAYKIAMIAKLNGTHLTLLMRPNPNLLYTKDILSEPKRILLEFFKLLFSSDYEDLELFLEDYKKRSIVASYGKVIQHYVQEMKLGSLEVLKPVL
ncbi:hypothetical protein [Candidatus Acidianus copahuensis]|uniref:Endonuclease n=1 Tax=Candidatus Acidianus copahuensis TaxID=1160895 RepID=A0A031LUH5_9CREN|nr:hypothetical protein [Candidatus Acidianus copahuensis]EZQ10798.1 hypothetical protein CM19_02900 [Candidatus Acidianus copahuensis]NON63253.1 hypothetical protein [Acidianus sp. RZ1]